MDLDTKFDEYSVEIGIDYGKKILGNQWHIAIESVLRIALSDVRNLPKLGLKASPISFKDYIEKWVNAYEKGYASRPSVKAGKPSSTAPDIIIGYLLQAKLPHLAGLSYKNH